MLISTHRERPSRDRDAHAIRLRDLAMMIVSMHGPSYRDVIEYRPQRGDAPQGLDIWQRDDVGTKMLGYQPITSGSPPLFNFAA
jgi:hypothetical protein